MSFWACEVSDSVAMSPPSVRSLDEPMGERCQTAEGCDLQSSLASLQALSVILWSVQMRTALTQHDLTPPAACSLNHQLPPHKPHDQTQSVYQQFCSEHTAPASLLPVKTHHCCPVLLHENWGTCTCFKMLNSPQVFLLLSWARPTIKAHNSDLLPPNYMINVVLRLQRTVYSTAKNVRPGLVPEGAYCREQPEKALLTCRSLPGAH